MTTETTKTAQHTDEMTIRALLTITRAQTRTREARRTLAVGQDNIELAANATGDTELWDMVKDLHDLIGEINRISIRLGEKLNDLCGGDLE